MGKEHLPPQNIEAEQAVLGAMLLQKEAIGKVLSLIREDDFYKPAHQKIFRTILKLFEKNEVADLITVTEELQKQNLLEEIGGANYLTDLVDSVASLANVEAYSKIIKDKSILRNLIDKSTQITEACFTAAEENIDELLDKAEGMIFNIAQERISRDFVPLTELLEKGFEEIERLYKKESRLTGLPSGFTDLDEKTSGFQDGDFIIIAGRPSMGKTAFCLEIAQYLGIHLKKPSAIFSLEMSKEQIVRRMLCSESRVDAHLLRTGRIKGEDFSKLSHALGKLSEAPIYIDDTPALSTLEIRAKARRLQAEKKISLVLIDYIQLIHNRTQAESRQQEIAEISCSLKNLAKELNIPVIACSQLNRAVESRVDKRPQLADLRESGALEQDADLILFLFRQEYYTKKEEDKGKAEVIIAKQRNGPVGTVELAFIDKYARFENLSYLEPRGLPPE
jgi:replicative DNA helicase